MRQATAAPALLLASGAAFFDPSFKSLPHVVDALSQPPKDYARTLDRLHHDLNAAEQALDRLVDEYGEALLESVANLSATSAEFETSQSRIRLVRQHISQAIASLTSRRRDVLNLSFREEQLVKMLEITQRLIRVAQLTECGDVRRASGLLDDLPKDLAPNIVAHLKSRLEARTVALIAQAKQDLASFAGGQHSHEVPTKSIEILRNHHELQSFVASLIHFELDPPTLVWNDAPLLLHPRYLALTVSPDSLVGPVEQLMGWGESLLARRVELARATECDCGVAILWDAVQRAVEDSLAPRLTVSSSASGSTARKSSSLLHDSLVRLDPLLQSASSTLVSSPYFLPAVSSKLLEFGRRNGALAGTRDGGLEAFIHRTMESCLIASIARDARWALARTPGDESTSAYVRLANRALALVAEIRQWVLASLDKSLARPVLGTALKSFIEVTSAKLVYFKEEAHPRDPLWLLLATVKKSPTKPMPPRRAILEACCEFARSNPVADASSNLALPRVDLLVAMHACTLRLERACIGDACEATFALISDRAIVAARSALEAQVRALDFTRNVDSAVKAVEMLEATFEASEGWADSRTAVDFVFMPLVAHMARALALKTVVSAQQVEMVEMALKVKAGLARILGDKQSDLVWFDGVLLLARAAATAVAPPVRHFLEAPVDDEDTARRKELRKIWIGRAVATGVIEADEVGSLARFG